MWFERELENRYHHYQIKEICLLYEEKISAMTKESVQSCNPIKSVIQTIIENIFQTFFTTKPTGSGTGLGLSLSYDIVKAHGGELKVEGKEGEGLPTGEPGSEFIIQLLISVNNELWK